MTYMKAKKNGGFLYKTDGTTYDIDFIDVVSTYMEAETENGGFAWL